MSQPTAALIAIDWQSPKEVTLIVGTKLANRYQLALHKHDVAVNLIPSREAVTKGLGRITKTGTTDTLNQEQL